MNLKDFEMMKSERWRQIRRIFDDAAKLAPANRAAFLRENCQADEDLRREIESLLSSWGIRHKPLIFYSSVFNAIREFGMLAYL